MGCEYGLTNVIRSLLRPDFEWPAGEARTVKPAGSKNGLIVDNRDPQKSGPVVELEVTRAELIAEPV